MFKKAISNKIMFLFQINFLKRMNFCLRVNLLMLVNKNKKIMVKYKKKNYRIILIKNVLSYNKILIRKINNLKIKMIKSNKLITL